MKEGKTESKRKCEREGEAKKREEESMRERG